MKRYLGDGAYAEWPIRGMLRLTAQGHRVLRGESDRAVLLGINRWVGGTHITPLNLWRWDDGSAVLVPPPTAALSD